MLWGEISVVEAGQTPPFDPRPQVLLHQTDHGAVLGPGKGECLARLFGPAGAADPVGVGVGGVGKIKVDYMGDFGDIDAVGGDVGSHQDVEFTVAEAVHGPLAGVLRHVALERRHPVRIPGQVQS